MLHVLVFLQTMVYSLFLQSLYCLHLVHGLGEGSGVIKKLPSGCRRHSGRSPDTWGMHRVPSKAAGPGAPSPSWGEADPSKGYSLAQRQPVCQVDAQLLAEFHLLVCEVILQDVTEMGVCTGRTRVWRSKRAWFRFFTTRAVSTVSRFHLTHLGTASAHPGRGYSHRTGLVSSRGQLSGEAAHILQSHSAMVEMDVQRAVRVGGLQMQAATSFMLASTLVE